MEVMLDRMFQGTVATGSVTWNPAQGLCNTENPEATQVDIGDCAGSTDDTLEYMDDSPEREFHEKEDEEYWQLVEITQAAIAYQAIYNEKNLGCIGAIDGTHIRAMIPVQDQIRFIGREGKYYLVDAGYPNPTGYLGPYKEVRYHLLEFQQGPAPTGYREVFNHAHSSLRSEIERALVS
ncbi:uncharacterized protein LOC120291995 [Eucalyptus grandis]|uniref:uncharacterized protein LOC120291995 n=1 Tax=Eucalyptus grandis TaxID=71139 RepID=UPI00192F0D0B|nr:uncharacterized protein LOC120291995 [Eucalyptus grandis]